MDPRLLAVRQQSQHQRFSWQPPPEEEAPPYEPPQQQYPPHAETNATTRDRAFSYAQTPIEHRDPFYASSNQPPLPQPPTPIDDRPQSFYVTQPQTQSTYVAATPYTIGGITSSPVSPQEGRTPRLFSPVSPVALVDAQHQAQPQSQAQAPLPQIDTQSQSNHARKLSNLSPINTNLTQVQANMPPVPQIPQAHRSQADPLPNKTPISPMSSGPIKSPSQTAEPYSPHNFGTTPVHAVFSPHAAHGPNGLDFALHQPGQIAHPNMDVSKGESRHEWKHSLCECSGDISTCLTGLFCPCIVYGRTSYRLGRKSDKKDPTDMLGYSATNGHCVVMGVSCGLWWLFPMIQRTRLRHLYKVKGSLGGDILKGCCCCCCVVIQNEREVRDREESARRWAGPASTEVYTAPAQMVYTPQR